MAAETGMDISPSIPYTLGERLGAGAFGEVFLARERDCLPAKPRQFAVKFIKCSGNEDVECAMQEIKAMVMLDHPHIVKILSFGLRQHWQIEVEFILLLEYCTNGNLNDRLDREISGHQRLCWMLGISEAVAYLHDEGIMHQDIKPDNILLSSNDVVKVADFGLARRFARRNEGQSRYQYYNDQGVGAMAYVAPEMLGETHTYKVDVFSMGIVFHAILERNFKLFGDQREKCYGVFVDAGNGEQEPLGIEMFEKGRDLSVPFRSYRRLLIVRMLKYNPRERPNANEVLLVLRTRWRRWIQLLIW